MLVIGLTGGIGSGKSVVADLFAAKGVPIIDADMIAREVTMPHQPCLTAIVEHFGADILHGDGTLNRARLRDIIFQHSNERRWLESCLHPVILARMQTLISDLHTPYCIAVIPLLIEANAIGFISRILVVDVTREAQLKRVAKRDGLSEKQIEAILATQVTREERLSKAHDVIANHGDLAELAVEVQWLHGFYLDLAS